VQQSQNFGFNERVFELVQPRLEAIDIAPRHACDYAQAVYKRRNHRLALAFLQGRTNNTVRPARADAPS